MWQLRNKLTVLYCLLQSGSSLHCLLTWLWLEMEGESQRGRQREKGRETRSCWFILYLSCFPLSSLLFRSHTDLHSPATNEGSTPSHCNATLWDSTHTHTHSHTQTVQLQHKTFSDARLLSHSSYTQCFHAHSLDNNPSFIPLTLQHTHTNTPMCVYGTVHTQNCKLSASGCAYV